MAIPWPQEADWPLEIREHAAELTKYLRDALNCIGRSQGQAVPASVVKTIITGMLTMISKTLRIPDLTTVHNILNIMRIEAKERTQATAKNMEVIKVELRDNATHIRRSITIGKRTKAAAEMATEKRTRAVDIVKELRDEATCVSACGKMSYAAVAANGMLASNVVCKTTQAGITAVPQHNAVSA